MSLSRSYDISYINRDNIVLTLLHCLLCHRLHDVTIYFLGEDGTNVVNSIFSAGSLGNYIEFPVGESRHNYIWPNLPLYFIVIVTYFMYTFFHYYVVCLYCNKGLVNARYVKIELGGEEYLQLGEVEV